MNIFNLHAEHKKIIMYFILIIFRRMYFANIQSERDFIIANSRRRKICTEKKDRSTNGTTRQFESRILPSSCKWTGA